MLNIKIVLFFMTSFVSKGLFAPDTPPQSPRVTTPRLTGQTYQALVAGGIIPGSAAPNTPVAGRSSSVEMADPEVVVPRPVDASKFVVPMPDAPLPAKASAPAKPPLAQVVRRPVEGSSSSRTSRRMAAALAFAAEDTLPSTVGGLDVPAALSVDRVQTPPVSPAESITSPTSQALPRRDSLLPEVDQLPSANPAPRRTLRGAAQAVIAGRRFAGVGRVEGLPGVGDGLMVDAAPAASGPVSDMTVPLGVLGAGGRPVLKRSDASASLVPTTGLALGSGVSSGETLGSSQGSGERRAGTLPPLMGRPNGAIPGRPVAMKSLPTIGGSSSGSDASGLARSTGSRGSEAPSRRPARLAPMAIGKR